jgi:hypothetical protein
MNTSSTTTVAPASLSGTISCRVMSTRSRFNERSCARSHL